MLPIAILCGGKGTRIAAVAGDLPKALVPVAGAPFLAHQLRWLRDAGATDVTLLTGYGAELIRAFAGDGSAYGLRVSYHADGPAPRGTAGAIKSALPLLGDAFLTVYGDALSLTDLNAVGAALTELYDGVMTVFPNHDRWLPSNARVTEGLVAAYDKKAAAGSMTHVDYGVNAFRARAFAGIPDDAFVDLAEVHRDMIDRGTLRAFPVSERWYEIGSPEGLRETEEFIRARSTGGHGKHDVR